MNGMVEGHYVVHVTLPPLVSGRIVKKVITMANMLNDFKSEIEKRFKEG